METKFIIKTLFIAWENGNYVVGPSDLSKKLDIPKSTAYKILIKMSKLGYGVYLERKGFLLTDKGLKEGKKLIRRHRLLECLLEDLGVRKELICIEASKIDLDIGEEFEKFIEKKYGQKVTCPCGKPIP
ncbi:MAG: metal-dependent transcriptional regulator [Archaeoglobaceae archaeon]|nr:metal-dependent transcriptional regulator [Archaeoglobaceae archaeon]MDW7990319.1 metal-dependent transcriptional regulator [Archaeoglobaceae archaeon]